MYITATINYVFILLAVYVFFFRLRGAQNLRQARVLRLDCTGTYSRRALAWFSYPTDIRCSICEHLSLKHNLSDRRLSYEVELSLSSQGSRRLSSIVSDENILCEPASIAHAMYDVITRFFPSFHTLQMEWLKIAPQ